MTLTSETYFFPRETKIRLLFLHEKSIYFFSNICKKILSENCDVRSFVFCILQDNYLIYNMLRHELKKNIILFPSPGKIKWFFFSYINMTRIGMFWKITTYSWQHINMVMTNETDKYTFKKTKNRSYSF